MSGVTGRRLGLTLLVGVAASVGVGCIPASYTIELPNGFEVHYLDGEIGLWASVSGHVVVKNGIAEYGAAEHCVVGRLGRPVAEGEPRPETGYFLVDGREYAGADPPAGEEIARPDRDPWGRTSSSGVYFGLTLEELGEMLERRGIAEIPELKVPSRKDAEFRLPFPTKVIS